MNRDVAEKPKEKPKEKKKKREPAYRVFLRSNRFLRHGMLVLVSIVFAAVLFPRLIIPEESYELGDIARKDVKAKTAFFVEDHEATEHKRRLAAKRVLTVYDYDTTLIEKTADRVQNAFAVMRGETDPAAAALKDVQAPAEKGDRRALLASLLGVSVSPEEFRLLRENNFSKTIADTVVQILRDILSVGVTANKEILLRESNKGIMLRTVGTDREVLALDLGRFYSLEQAENSIRLIGLSRLNHLKYPLDNFVVDLVRKLLQPNITLNRNETEKRIRQAVENVQPVLHRIKPGEMLIREGQRVTETHLLKLRALHSDQHRTRLIVRSLGAVLIVLVWLIVYYRLFFIPSTAPADRNRDLLFHCVMLVAFFFVPKLAAAFFASVNTGAAGADAVVYGIPLAAGSMTVCLFLGMEAAVPFSTVIAVCSALIYQSRFEIFVYFLLSCILGAYWMQECRERKVFIKAGAKLGLFNALLACIISLYMAEIGGMALLTRLIFAFLGGAAAGIITAGLTPLLEIAFDYTTDISLMEAANLEQPMLRRLMIEAPGTYHHSVVVGSLVAAAAAEIGANPLLGKVCGYYHDIGKIKKPLYFVENQTDGKNRHDKLAPSMSSLILTSHVKDGVEMAKQHKLGKVITDTIRQHHGTSLIHYFYEKAKQQKGEAAVNIDNFRYPGPKPQTREAGLVMLADVVEASSRTLENPTPARIKGHVRKMINKVFTDGQLDECELTLKDINDIAHCFYKFLNGIHHHRVEYQESTAEGKDRKERKDRNGSPDRQPAKPASDKSDKDTTDRDGPVKRIGIR